MVIDILEDTAIFPMLDELRACLCAALGDTAPCFCGIVVGSDIPVDYVGSCEDENGDPACGVAYVRVIGAYPTDNFPDALSRATCNSVMVYQVAIGVLRCASIGEENGGPVDPDELKALSLQLLSDMKAMRRAIQCCFMNAFPDAEHIMGTFTPLPQEGGVAGGEWPVAILEAF